MKIHTYRSALTIALIFLSASALSENTPELNIASVPAIVEIETRQGPREFIQLPTLRYDLEIQQECPADLKPANLSVSVADTRRTMSANELSEASALTMPLSIPRAQIAPVAIAGFCAAIGDDIHGTNSRGGDILGIKDVLSLQAALLCAGDTGSQIYYASIALDVELRCKLPGPDVQPIAKYGNRGC
tara:strand:- start:14 stop:577 length:564 start_codon:yes stop_codon:yes gene_type:complete